MSDAGIGEPGSGPVAGQGGPSSGAGLENPGAHCRFGKRNLDKLSWVAPLVNNRFGDLLNLEMRHHQLFFLQGDRVLEDIGYSDKGKRFSEAEFGKPIRNLDDLKKSGYWLVGRAYDTEVMREALRRQRDGGYYSFFSNQCQDWTDRLRRVAERIERERGLAPQKGRGRGPKSGAERRVLPTEPASIGMALVALALGVGGIMAPALAGGAFSAVLGAFFLAAGVSHVVFAFRSRDSSNLLFALLMSLINLAAGTLMVVNRDLARTAGSVLIAAALGAQGASHVFIGLFSRPRSYWVGTLLAGIVMLMSAAVIASRWPASGDRALGVVVGASLLAGGLSTIWLNWKARRSEEAS